ncbi:haloacid dehalogenase type II [Ancylomarina sp. 16SWW S1-10-2]|uniref:haloacid dehalogenase type II n=1 Tax=Ancylomarina sp. 16SWW S1-10-2 TaxID=2499681 RepID=UPI0012ADC467|nr:haloacid dehalogenase type II [Ancylomarina sp. 16SWW S1-10-2]MRT92307.1 haloacid dehalogenase type II [Ancylomarina sp. 16SWW S1-10-2]
MKYTLAFDVYGTLINTSGVYNSLEKLIGEQAKLFMETWRNKQLEYSFKRGIMNKYVDFSVCTKDSLNYCCEVFKTDLNKAQIDSLMDEYSVLPTFPDVDTELKKLKKSGHRLFAFSNGSEKAVSNLLTNANIIERFDGIISVENIKTFKPNPLVYKHFNTETNSTKSDSWLISSNPFDVIGAISYGMRSAWVQRSPDSIFDPWGIEPTTIINKLTDLSSKLEMNE